MQRQLDELRRERGDIDVLKASLRQRYGEGGNRIIYDEPTVELGTHPLASQNRVAVVIIR